AQQARERTGEPGVAVAGSLSEMALSGLITPGDDAISAVEAFRVQATALADAGVDLLVLEMMRSETVTESALQAAAHGREQAPRARTGSRRRRDDHACRYRRRGEGAADSQASLAGATRRLPARRRMDAAQLGLQRDIATGFRRQGCSLG